MFSQRVRRMQPSVTVELNARVTELIRKGQDIITLNVGEPDFVTPAHINQAAYEAIAAGFTKYTPVNGIYELRQAVCEKLRHENQVAYEPTEIIVSTGAKQALVNAILALCDDGDEVMVPIPCWVSFIEMVKLAGSEPVLVPTAEENGFQLDLEAIKRAISPRTKAIIINSPNNPTGAVYPKHDLSALAELALQHDFYIIADEVYEKLVYDDAVHISVASLSPEIRERTVLINSLSKAYAMTGWRVGYSAAPLAITQAMRALQGHMTTTTNSIAQKAAVAALTGPADSIESMRQEFDTRRQYLFQRLTQIQSLDVGDVKGAFYFLPNISRLLGKQSQNKVLRNSFDMANFILDEAQVAVVPGGAFEAPQHLRISYSNSQENLMKAMNRLEQALKKLT